MIKKVNENNTNINTYYLSGGFQYEEIITSTTSQMPQLKFFPHAEGYVNVEQGRSTSYFNYVFNYTDHLGNIRLSYGYDPSIQTTKIIEENHYYAFGLKHTGYNSDLLLWMEDIDTDRISLQQSQIKTAAPAFVPKSSGYQYKYNGKELQTELGLNLDNYKWRNYDYTIGRFVSIDPLARDFPQWSPYVFSGNYVLVSKELEGLEPQFMIGQDGKLTAPMVTLMNSAYGYSWKSLTNTNWVPHTDARAQYFSKSAVPDRAVAITLGNQVVFDSALNGSAYLNSSRGKEYWFTLIGHEQRHRFDIDTFGKTAFYSTYALSGTSALGIHDNIAHEQIANKFEEYAGKLWNYNNGEVQNILQSGMSDSQKSSKLEIVGSKFKRDVVLQDAIDSANNTISSSQKALNDAKGTIAEPYITKFLNDVINAKKDVINKAQKEQQEITKKYGN